MDLGVTSRLVGESSCRAINGTVVTNAFGGVRFDPEGLDRAKGSYPPSGARRGAGAVQGVP